MKGKCRPGRRRLCARERPGHYEEELVVGLLRREERCDVRENGGRSSNRDRALSGNAAKPCEKEGGRKGERKRKGGGVGGPEGMKAPRIYEGFVFPLKNNVSRNSGYDMQPRGRTSLLFYRCDTNALLEIVARGKGVSRCNI